MPGSYFDTNVLVYIASGDPAKADRAEAAVAAGSAISVQVLNKLTNVARRKMPLSWAENGCVSDPAARSAHGSSSHR
jgi:predicted nucleic acid-binding protein